MNCSSRSSIQLNTSMHNIWTQIVVHGNGQPRFILDLGVSRSWRRNTRRDQGVEGEACMRTKRTELRISLGLLCRRGYITGPKPGQYLRRHQYKTGQSHYKETISHALACVCIIVDFNDFVGVCIFSRYLKEVTTSTVRFLPLLLSKTHT